ncbi:glycoside hydrolase family 95 protein [Cohnella ginsengisoli]|uniref:Glycoside hydrolase family 95 protein n=1 Tax=Cohnella ginsengisoli TaxID=425004 RepID=A0A9X4KGF5_9BACL|nr:glycoside hydrolase family 95 protein [Cohnella ginsengisoli]MDG0791486.1 glycoside hydrolase family 95 protein [Cohnella ginsengisoli]
MNEDSLWYGGPRDRNNPDALPNLPRIRELILAGRLREAEDLALMALTGVPESQRHYLPLGDLELQGAAAGSRVEQYERELDLGCGLFAASYSQEGVRYAREAFASYPDQVIVYRLAADKPSSLSFRARWNRQQRRNLDGIRSWGTDGLVMSGHAGGEGGANFRAAVKAVVKGGQLPHDWRIFGDRAGGRSDLVHRGRNDVPFAGPRARLQGGHRRGGASFLRGIARTPCLRLPRLVQSGASGNLGRRAG